MRRIIAASRRCARLLFGDQTLLDYDRHDHAFQQAARQRDFEGDQPEPYTGALHGTWARVPMNGRLCCLEDDRLL